jgi:two-component system, LuxR family, sensor kinase FixL
MRSPKQVFRTLLARDRIVLLVILFVSIVSCAVVAADLQAAILTAVRSYVGGEGLWSKAQKASVYHLTRYATSHREEDFELYRRAIDVPLGDRQARLELEKPGPDLEVVREGFLRGNIHPDDIPGMASLFRNFRRVSYMARAIAIWAEGDRLIRELQRLAGELHAEVSSGHPESERVQVILGEIARVDAELTPLEDAFSKDLGEGARWAHAWMTRAIYTASLLLVVIGVLLSRRMLIAARSEREVATLHRAIVDEALDCIITADRDGRILEFNPAAERTFGWTRDEAIGRLVAETVVPTGLRAAHLAGMRRYLETAEKRVLERRMEMTAIRKDGTEFPVELAVSAIARGSTTIFAAHIQDLTERKEAEKAIRESEARKRAAEELLETQRLVERVADATPHILYLFDVQEQRVLYVNKQMTRVLGYGPIAPEMGLAFLRERLHPEELAELPTAIGAWFEGVTDDQVVEAEIRVKDAAGAWRWIHSRNIVFARDVAGNPRQVLGTAQDVTERKRADDLARQHEAALAHALRVSTLGEMAAGLAHELNQPLAAIVSYARGCTRRLRSGAANPNDLVPAIEQISAQALRAGEYIHHLRTFVTKDKASREPVDVTDLLQDVARLIAPEARRLGVSIDLEISAAPLVVVGARIQIEQVMLNLVRNAFDAMRDQPVAERTVAISAESAGEGGVIIAVRDAGAGLSPEVAQQVFEPFFTTKPQGMGMGLAISRSIVEAHGGQIRATPNETRGTTFWVKLPTDADEHRDRPAESGSDRREGRGGARA